MEIATGMSDVVLAVGVDKHGDGRRAANKNGLESLSDTATLPPVKFAMMARTYLRAIGRRRPVLGIALPGKAMRDYRAGNHLTPERAARDAEARRAAATRVEFLTMQTTR